MQLPITHEPGRHCASTAVADICRFHGAPLSEAMCFGLGEGLGLYYVGLPGMKPSRILHGRSLDFEKQFFERIGLEFSWVQHDDPYASERSLISTLDEGRPALVQTDIYYLPYYNSKTHFAGHLIAVWGYDKADKVFYVTDTERTDIYEVPFEAMRRARYCAVPPFPMAGNLFSPASISVPADLGDRALDAIRKNSRRLRDAEASYEGLNALRSWQNDLAEWANFEDAKWTARLAYQTIVKRGTGGGAFRSMYAEFLREAGAMNDTIAKANLEGLMCDLGEAWDRLGAALRELSDAETFEPEKIRPPLNEVAEREIDYHSKASEL